MMSLAKVVKRLAAVALALLDEDRPLLSRTVQFIKWQLDERYDKLVKEHADTPMIQAYQGDASPLLVRARWMHSIGLSEYRREAQRKLDFYYMRAYLGLVDADGKVHLRALVREPVMLPNKEK